MSKSNDQLSVEREAERLNDRLLPARASLNTALIGLPRGNFTVNCQEATDHAFIAQVVKFTFARTSGWALAPFAAVLERVDHDLRRFLSRRMLRLGHDGALCCRLSRQSNDVISNHSWGIAIDLTLHPQDPTTGDEPDLSLLLDVAEILSAHDLYWGASFPKPEPMHFEASEQLIRFWAAEGDIRGAQETEDWCLQYGDRSLGVMRLQIGLNQLLDPSRIAEDGVFGTDTTSAVIEAHVRLGLPPCAQASRHFIKTLMP